MKEVVIIFGYNNTRVYDIQRLKKLCKKMLNADIMLCKENISSMDSDITPYSLAINLEIKNIEVIKQQISIIDEFVLKHQLNPIACLPFSDKGIPLGTYYAESRGLHHDNCERSFACIDKYTYRCLEQQAQTPEWFKKPFFTKIYSYAEAKEIILSKKIPLFFKPTSEGNSRGCIEINSLQDLEENKSILESYFTQGIIIEECIKGCDEYSFDGVDGDYIITEKKTSQGHYRVETQHILPAPLSEQHYHRLIEAGKIVSAISGSDNGAVHNELFLNKNTGEVYCVEPNRRPAGLKLWDWVSIAFPGVHNWSKWVAWASKKTMTTVSPTHHSFHVGCRMLKAPQCGTLKSFNALEFKKLEKLPDVVEIILSKTQGSKVTSILKDNSDFLGYVVCKNKTIEQLHISLNEIEKRVIDSLTIQ